MHKTCTIAGLLLGLFTACSPAHTPNNNPPTGSTNQGIQRIPCTVTTDCRARGGSCTQGECTAANECATDADCAPREVCTTDANFGGLCGAPQATATPMPPWACAADADCPTAQVCTRGSCELPQTTTPTVTPPPPPPPACSTDRDCAQGEICRADGVCIANPWACTTDADCNARGNYVCTNGQCGIASEHGCNGSNCPCDVLNNNCQFGMRCYPFGANTSDGQCFTPGARQAGDACVEPPFGEPESCGLGLVCGYASENDPTGICFTICGTDADCSGTDVCRHVPDEVFGQTPQWGLCAAPPPPPPPPPPPVCDPFAQDCTSASDLCAPVDLGANVCVPAGRGGDGASCTQASDCAPGLACVAFAGSTPTTNYFTLFQDYIDRGGGTCKTICAPGRACSATQDCAPISTSATGETRTDVGVCD
ncbi:MAG: hypothetical protein U1E65_09700 [Myxococcota bacterium]